MNRQGSDRVETERESMLTWIENQVESTHDLAVLRALHDEMPNVARGWKQRGVSSAEICSFINCWHDKMIIRVIELVIADMERAGWRTPPTPFCWLLLGSGGRMEQTLQPDQDNALLYRGESSGESDAIGLYFKTFAEMVVTRLAAIGYPYCPGFVMATNSRWNLPLNQWQRTIESYADYPNWDNARFLMMAADIRSVYGDVRLSDQFQTWFFQQVRPLSFIHWQVADHGFSHSVALDFFDRLRIEKWGEHEGQLNIKEGGYLQIVNSTRLWAVANGIAATSTAERIMALRDSQIWYDELASSVMEALHLFMQYRLWSNYVSPDKLSDSTVADLKDAIKTAARLQKLTSKQFRKPK